MNINFIGLDGSPTYGTNRQRGGWTLAEMLLIIAVIVFLAAIVTSLVDIQRRRAAGINRTNNIQRIKFPFKTWSVDSNALNIAESFAAGKFDGNVSYFVGVDVSNSYPQMIVLGDRSMASNGVR